MKQILFSDWLPERQDEEQGEPILPSLDYPLCSAKAYNQSFTDQTCLVEMAKYYPCIFIDLSLISVHKNAKGTWPTTSYLDLTLGQ